MSEEKSGKSLLTASDAARLLEVDLKTIHNWVDRGHFPAECWLRTPGKHLRFKVEPFYAWMRAQGYSVPGEINIGPRQAAADLVAQATLKAEALIDCVTGTENVREVGAMLRLLTQASQTDPMLGTALALARASAGTKAA